MTQDAAPSTRSPLPLEAIVAAARRVPRERFVIPALEDLAYAGFPLPIGSEQTISALQTVVATCQALRLGGGERVLEVGTGSGYQAAVLAELGCTVYTVERVAELSRAARRLLDSLGYLHVLVRWGDGGEGWPEYAPYQRIVVTAACPQVPPPLVDQLDVGGVLVAPVGDGRHQELVRVTKGSQGRVSSVSLGECRFVPLLGKWGWNGREARAGW